MPTITDPARELADICVKLHCHPDKRGDQHLADVFDVQPWSAEFFQIIFCIVERADFLIDLIGELDLDQDYKTEAVNHINLVKEAFSRDALAGPWKNAGYQHIAPANVQPIKMLSLAVRQLVQYPKLSDEEAHAILAEVNELTDWLDQHQTKENDFIRQALLDGLKQFRFRLERVGWLGWGYTLDSLREVIGAYLALERGMPEPGIDPVAEAALKKVSALVTGFYKKTKKIGRASCRERV